MEILSAFKKVALNYCSFTETIAISVKVKMLNAKRVEKSIILHAKIFPAKILFHKKFFDFSHFLMPYERHFEIKFLKFLLEPDRFL